MESMWEKFREARERKESASRGVVKEGGVGTNLGADKSDDIPKSIPKSIPKDVPKSVPKRKTRKELQAAAVERRGGGRLLTGRSTILSCVI